MSFDYPYTCPKIDKQIRAAKDSIEQSFKSLLEEVCPLLPEYKVIEVSTDYTSDLYSELEDVFETVRGTNEDMRKSAEKKVNDLEDEVRHLESELEDRRAEISDLRLGIGV